MQFKVRAICRPIVVVSTDVREQARRVQARDGATPASAAAAAAAQLPLAIYEQRADLVLWNGAGVAPDALRAAARAAFDAVLRWL